MSTAPRPFDTFAAGAFYGFMAAAEGKPVHDVTEDEIRQAMRDWLEERQAAAS